jgi:hypothetical protein
MKKFTVALVAMYMSCVGVSAAFAAESNSTADASAASAASSSAAAGASAGAVVGVGVNASGGTGGSNGPLTISTSTANSSKAFVFSPAAAGAAIAAPVAGGNGKVFTVKCGPYREVVTVKAPYKKGKKVFYMEGQHTSQSLPVTASSKEVQEGPGNFVMRYGSFFWKEEKPDGSIELWGHEITENEVSYGMS